MGRCTHIFTAFDRTDDTPASQGESTFDFLNRCARPSIELVRQELEKWFVHYPDAERDELLSRFHKEFYSPFFELLLHELFCRLGATLAAHPQVGTENKRPDFLVQFDDGRSLLLEATLSEENESDSGKKNRLTQIYDAINAIDCPDFFLVISDITETSDKPLVPRRVIAFLKCELGKRDYEAVFQHYENSKELPLLEFKDEGCCVRFEVIPKRREACGRPGVRPIGMYPARFQWGGSQQRVVRSLFDKCNHYGKTGMPFVLAVNTFGPWGNDKQEQRAVLFGREQENVGAGTGELSTRSLGDGLWGTETNRKCTRISAVLFGVALPWNVPRIEFCLYENPWAAHPLPDDVWPLQHATWENGHVRYSPGQKSITEILELDPDWPGAIFD